MLAHRSRCPGIVGPPSSASILVPGTRTFTLFLHLPFYDLFFMFVVFFGSSVPL